MVALVAGGCGDGDAFQSNCTAAAPSEEALAPARRNPDGSVILPDGRKISPAGTVLTTGGFPLQMRVLPQAGERYVVVTDGAYGDQHLRIIDSQAAAAANPVVANVDYIRSSSDASDPALFFGLALSADGSRLYVSNGGYDPKYGIENDLSKHYNVVEVFDIAGTPPQLTRAGEIHLPFAGGANKLARMPSGLALSGDGKTLYVACQFDGTLAIVDVAAGPTQFMEVARTMSLGTGPYDVALDESTGTAFVSLWGGKFLRVGAFDDGVVPVDVSDPMNPVAGTVIKTGKSPEQALLVGGKVYVAAADGDSIAAIDPTSKMVSLTGTAFDASGLVGSAPNALAADLARDRLYVANAGENGVQAFQLSTMAPLGRVPAAWYPTAVAVKSDGTLLIASAKGLGAGASDHAPERNDYMQGTMQVVPLPSAQDLTMGDATVHANLTRPKSYEVQLACTGMPQKFPLPAVKGAPTPIEHVFLIVRENKTYDAVLGDLAGANGRADLALFGGDITPNLHALAKRFTNLDNFYSLAEQSLQGHEWTTANMANDYTEKGWLTTWGRATRPLGAFSASDELEHLAMPQTQTAWTHLDSASIAYHNYGEIVNTTGAITVYDVGYPGVFFNTGILDVDKVQYVIDNLHDKTFKLEPFSYISLPNDHTVGTSPGQPTPQSMVADNDEATGRFIDALSKSEYWKSSVVFLIEDDPQDGGDHVELHRSPCLVISPWTRRGYTSSVHYDVPAMWRTITMLLGVDPINQRDGNAPAMYDVFSPTADAEAYTFVPRKIPMTVNSLSAPMAAESKRIDFTKPDTAPLGRILWKAMKGANAEPPWGKKSLVQQQDDDD
ncbi:MAG: beta-propeller repeat-containing protein [Myxococcales bacterium]|nr:beta-propeller repeat-containing protein [Myxococcales bacterium]